MKIKNSIQLFAMMFILLVGCGCHSEAPLTKEEMTANKRYHREPIEEKEYYFKAAGFAVKPPPPIPFEQSYVKIRNTDGIEFTEGEENQREPRYYVGRLSTYFYNFGPYDSLNTAVSNIKALVENCQKRCTIKVIEDSLMTYGGYSVHKFSWLLVDGGSWPVSDIQMRQGVSRDAVMIGAVVETDKGTYLVTLAENNLNAVILKGPEVCVDGWDEVSAKDATAMMENKFQKFLQGISFDRD